MTSRYEHNEEFFLEKGESLPSLEVTYSTYGTLNEKKDNVIWIGHALTANSDPKEWWPGLVGPGLPIDDTKYFVVCVNMLGSCYGTTGPRSNNPTTGKPYGISFPSITVKDMVNVLEIVRRELGIVKIHLGIGGSMGGQQLLEWASLRPDLFEKLIVIGTNVKHSPWGKAYNSVQLTALENDPTFIENNEEAGCQGLELARGIAIISYRSYMAFEKTQQDVSNATDDFRADSYLKYQGLKLSKRFHAHSYKYLVAAMSSHDISRYRKQEMADIIRSIESEIYAVGITSDQLFPPGEQKFIAKNAKKGQFFEIDSPFGHDGFLIEFEKLSVIIGVALS